MSTWTLRDAQTHLADVIDKALTEGPQTICENGVGVVVLSEDQYRLMSERKPTFKEHLLGGPKVDEPEPDFIAFLLGGPKVDDFTIERDPDTGRDVDL